MTAGFPGAMIATLPRGIGSVLDAADLDPFWAAADETGALIHIHPSYDAGDVRVNDFGLANGARPHHRRGGGGGAADLGRPCHALPQRQDSSRRWAPPGCRSCSAGSSAITRSRPASPIRPRRWRTIYTDSILHDPRVLRFVVEMIGTDRVMMGSDMPFPIGDKEPMKIVAAAGLPKAQAASINGGLAAKLFRIQ